jgi:hypothetical protein
MGHIDLTRSEQDFYETVSQQVNTLLMEAKTKGQTLLTQMVTSICETHNAEVPQQFDTIRDKRGKTIAMLWGQELKLWREGVLNIPGAVYPPGLPVKPKMLEVKAESVAPNSAPTPG